MNILGIHLEHDASATILVDGAPAAIVEAERIIQVKHAWGPEACVAAVRRALDQTGIGASEIDAIAYSDLWDSEPFGSGSSKRDRDPAVQAYTHAASGVMRIDFPQLRDKLAIPELRRELPVFITCHAHSHAAAALYSSGFERASGLVYDGYGTCCGMMAYRYDGLCLHRLDAWQDRFLLGAGYYVIGTRIAEIYPATHMLDTGQVDGVARVW